MASILASTVTPADDPVAEEKRQAKLPFCQTRG
jgi:hypothetical protein